MINFSVLYEEFEACESVPDASRVVSRALADLGLTQFVYLCWSHESLSVELSIHTYSQAWTNRYVAQGYDRIDPVIGLAFASKVPFLWDAADFLEDEKATQFFDEADQYGLYMGVTVPLKTTPNRRIFITFAAPRHAPKFEEIRSLPSFMPTVKFLALSLHRTVSRIQTEHLVLLTPREAEALKLACVGLNAAEIAAAINLSVDTINEVLSRAARKLGQENRASACHMFGRSFEKLKKPQ
jgi:DNA-binding CsgD family transcriptional regulator